MMNTILGSGTALSDKIEMLLALPDFTEYYAMADNIRRENMGDVVHIRAILEFSNYCRCACAYCGINANCRIERYKMNPDEIVKAVFEAHEAGYKTIVLQSGEDPWYTCEIVGDIVRRIKECGISITLSIGERSFSELKHWRECGADRYLLKHETADRKLFEKLHGVTIDGRIRCLKDIKKLGYETGSGFMVGLPGQSLKTLAADILLLKELRCDMAGIGPFIPSPETSLNSEAIGSTELTKRCVALTRILMPKIHLPATTALGVIDKAEKDMIFSCGANVIMNKITPTELKMLYKIYPGELGRTDIKNDFKKLCTEISKLDRAPL